MKKQAIWAFAAMLLLGVGCLSLKTSKISSEQGLIAYYPLDGNACDASGNGYDGLASGVSYEEGHLGKAARLIGTYDSFIRMDRFPRMKNPFTISAWIRPEFPIGAKAVFCKGRTKSVYDLIILEDCVQSWPNFPDPGWQNPVSNVGALPTNRFFNIAMIFDTGAKEIHYFVDGERKATAKGNLIFEETNEPFYLGIDPPGGPELYSGLIDDVRVYCRALTEDELRILAMEPPK